MQSNPSYATSPRPCAAREANSKSENTKLRQRIAEMERHMLESGKAMAHREEEHSREKEHCKRLLLAATSRTTTTAEAKVTLHLA